MSAMNWHDYVRSHLTDVTGDAARDEEIVRNPSDCVAKVRFPLEIRMSQLRTALALLLLVASTAPQVMAQEVVFEESVALSPGGRLTLRATKGSVRLVSWDPSDRGYSRSDRGARAVGPGVRSARGGSDEGRCRERSRVRPDSVELRRPGDALVLVSLASRAAIGSL